MSNGSTAQPRSTACKQTFVPSWLVFFLFCLAIQSSSSKQSITYPSPAFHFLAGLTTGTFSAILLQPADLLKTRLQQPHTTFLSTFRSMISGPRPLINLWRGTVPSVLRTGFGSALYFSTLNTLRQSLARNSLLPSTKVITHVAKYSSSSLPKLSNSANLATGAIARVGAGLVLMPLTVLKVRYESNLFSYKSLWSAGSVIYHHEGLRGFFKGFGATAIRDAPYAGMYVLFYEQFKCRLSTLQRITAAQNASSAVVGEIVPLSSLTINFSSGILAATLATAITNPFDAIKTRLQLMPFKYANTLQAGRQIIREEGTMRLFDGLSLRIGRKALSSALAWTFYEELVRRAEGRW